MVELAQRDTRNGKKGFANASDYLETWDDSDSITVVNAQKIFDEDMNTLDTTKNIAYMHICQVISSANYSIIYLCYPEQKYFTLLCFV